MEWGHGSNVGEANAYMPARLRRPQVHPDIPFQVQCHVVDMIEGLLAHQEWLLNRTSTPQYKLEQWRSKCIEAVCFADEQGFVSHIGMHARLSERRFDKTLVDPGESAVLTGTECPDCHRPQFRVVGNVIMCAALHKDKPNESK